MNESVIFHRDASRIAREQAKKYKERGNLERENLWLQQSSWHSFEASRLESIGEEVKQKEELIFLLAKEAWLQGWSFGWLDLTAFKSLMIIRHPFCGLLQWTVNNKSIPDWVPVYPDGVSSDIGINQSERISIYLRKPQEPDEPYN